MLESCQAAIPAARGSFPRKIATALELIRRLFAIEDVVEKLDRERGQTLPPI